MIKDKSKKKIRGFKRRVKAIDAWKNNNLDLDLQYLEDYSRDYVKVWIHPFYSLSQYTLPNWYKRKVIDALLEIYDSYKKTLKENYEDYYLRVWIFEKDFMASQVVVAVGDMMKFYSNSFMNDSKIESLNERLQTKNSLNLEWQSAIHPIHYYESELQKYLESGLYTQKEVKEIQTKSLSKEIIQDKVVYVVKGDDVYIGKRP